jgi:uncharacterized SAM-binding protein YcdF (DUF218 family)
LKSRVLSLSLIFLVLFGWAFTHEAKNVLKQTVNSWTDEQAADCAVVLTGGAQRVREGFDLLSRHSIQKLIVSGVNPQVELKEVFPLWPYYGDLSEQNVILEKRSRTTYGNAQQSLVLLEALHCRDVIIVTSKLHMYRAMRTFKAELPQNLMIYPRALPGATSENGWSDIGLEVFKSLFYSLWAY